MTSDLEVGDYVLCRGFWTVLKRIGADGRLTVYEPTMHHTGAIDRDEVQNWAKASQAPQTLREGEG